MAAQFRMPKFDNVFTIGNVIMLVAMASGGVWFQATTTAQQRAFQDQILLEISRIDAMVRADESRTSEREARIRALELGAGRIDERLVSISQSLTRIERQLETIP